MKMTIRSFSVIQTAKITAIVYSLIALISWPLFLFPRVTDPNASKISIVFVTFLPFVYGVMGFLMTAIGCLLYNWLAKFVGGVEFTVEEKP
jgi:hypothetical protein